MSETESEKLGGVMVNGIGHESPAVGVSGSKPLVNGHLRDGEKEEDEYPAGGTVPATDGAGESITATGKGEVAVKTTSPVSMIVSSAAGKSQTIYSSGKPRSSGYHTRQHRLPAVNYYRYVPITGQQATPVFYPTQPQTYMGGHIQGGAGGQLSSTNLYIRGLSQRCSDDDLVTMCQQYGRIVSTKAILDKQTNLCKGYGFVDFENPADALKAVQSLQSTGVLAQFAKVPQQQEQDPTNLYFSNLPKSYEEKSLEQLVAPCGNIVSTRILRDQAGLSRGVGFVRLDTKENCEKAIEMLNGSTLPDSPEPLMVKFADSSSNKKRQHGQGRWREMAEYVYEAPHILTQNGVQVNSRSIMQQGVVASPTQTALAASSSVEGVAGLSSHLNHLHISTSSPYTGQPQPTAFTGQPQPHPSAYQIAPQGTQYAQQTPGGWTFSHTPMLPQQDHSSELHASVGDSKAHHIQVITPDHTPSVQDDPSHPVHLYYPNSSWTGK